MKVRRSIAIAIFIAVVVIASLSAITLLVIWNDGSWNAHGDPQIRYMIRANGVIVAAGIGLAIILWRIIRR